MVPRQAFWWATVGVLLGCGTRDRLTFPSESPGDSAAPVTRITSPAQPDTAVVGGDLLIVQGRVVDVDGVDAVYFEVQGSNQGFAPLRGEGADTVYFALQLSTQNASGATVLFRAYGVDRLGDQGDPDSRQIHIE